MPASSSTDPFGHLSQQDLEEARQLIWQVLTDATTKHDFIMPPEPHCAILQRQGACFVSIYVDAQLRGCTGSIKAHSALWQDLCKRAYTTTQDSRFAPLTESELASLSFNINILTPLIPIENQGEQKLLETLEPEIDGLLIADNNHQAVFLPTVWHSLPKPKDFVDALKHKAGWPSNYWNDAIELHRFYTFEYSSQ